MKTAWLILQILGAIVAIWLILRIFIKQKLYARWKSTMYIRIVGLVIVGCAGISLLLLYIFDNNFSNEKRGNDAIRSSILNMDTSMVKNMGISYTNGISLGNGLIAKPLLIKERNSIKKIAMELHKMSKYSPNHPMSEWDIFL